MITSNDRYDSLFQFYGEVHAVDWKLLKCQVQVESGFRPHATSPVGAKGLAQFMDATWAEWGEGSPYDPEASIEAQASYLSYLLKHYGGDVRMALAAYNGGMGRLDRVGFESMPQESRDYAKKIAALYE